MVFVGVGDGCRPLVLRLLWLFSLRPRWLAAVAARRRCQTRRSRAGDPHQNRSTATLLEHLQSNGAYGRGSSLQGLIHRDIGPGPDPGRIGTPLPPILRYAWGTLREPVGSRPVFEFPWLCRSPVG
jgi:hypothetical protein